jgi:hypothetical protein
MSRCFFCLGAVAGVSAVIVPHAVSLVVQAGIVLAPKSIPVLRLSERRVRA